MLFARQPIFDMNQTVYGYELLYREVGQEEYRCENGTLATSTVIAGSLLSVDYYDLVGDKKVFIHFTEALLSKDIATLFPKERLAVEIVDLISEPSHELVDACMRLHDQGYLMVFDASIFKQGFEQLAQIADIVKIDYLETSMAQVEQWVKQFKDKIKFLATKLEDIEAFNLAKAAGCVYFQGYYFSKPVLMSSNNLAPNRLNALRIMNALRKDELDFKEVSQIIERDVAFSYEILKLANSVYFSRRTKINSVRDALLRLGSKEIKKWGIIAAVKRTAEQSQHEILNFSLVRAKFMEQFADEIGQNKRGSQFLTVGILSMIDALMNINMEKILADLCISQEISDALLGNKPDQDLYLALQIILSCEQGEWKEVKRIADLFHVSLITIANIHNEAIKWTLDLQRHMK